MDLSSAVRFLSTPVWPDDLDNEAGRKKAPENLAILGIKERNFKKPSKRWLLFVFILRYH